LGNVRLSYGRDPQARNEIKILEENHYYPYGLKHTNYNANLNAFKKDNNDQVQLTGTGLSADLINKYKFNGCEYQDELGLNLYDMDMRDYDPAIGRWTGIDPVTHFSQSPYCAFDNNPALIADPSGADGEPINTWHYSGGGSMYSGAGNMSSGDHMFGSTGDSFWMNNIATTGYGVVGAISMYGNTVSVYWNSVSNGTTASFDNGVRTGIQQRDPLVRADGTRIKNADVNGDGITTLIELNYWYRNGNSEEINIKASSVSMAGVDPNLFSGKKRGDIVTVNLLYSDFWGGEGTLYGQLDFEYRGGNKVRIVSNTYDFDVGANAGHPWFNSFGGFVRNVGTILGNVAAGSGSPFLINFLGTTTLSAYPK
jgi:RHS repeat-associated protein